MPVAKEWPEFDTYLPILPPHTNCTISDRTNEPYKRLRDELGSFEDLDECIYCVGTLELKSNLWISTTASDSDVQKWTVTIDLKDTFAARNTPDHQMKQIKHRVHKLLPGFLERFSTDTELVVTSDRAEDQAEYECLETLLAVGKGTRRTYLALRCPTETEESIGNADTLPGQPSCMSFKTCSGVTRHFVLYLPNKQSGASRLEARRSRQEQASMSPSLYESIDIL